MNKIWEKRKDRLFYWWLLVSATLLTLSTFVNTDFSFILLFVIPMWYYVFKHSKD